MPDRELKPGENTGLLIKPPSPGGFIAGGETGIVPEVLEESGQYDIYLPEEESQFSPADEPPLDSSGCVTESAQNLLETSLNRQRNLGLIPATHEIYLKEDGYVNPQSNKVNFSGRATAKWSGTTKKGNYFENVAYSIAENDGLIPEKDWPWPTMKDIPGLDPISSDLRWNRYYQDIPQELKTKGRKFLRYFDIKFEWVITGQSNNDKLRDRLKYGPIQIAVDVCSPWSSTEGMPPIKACGCTSRHGIELYGYKEDKSLKVFDTYKSYKKLLAHDYCIPWALQYTIKPKLLTPKPIFLYYFKYDLKFGAPIGPEVINLQKALQSLRRANGQAYMKLGVFGPFGPQTKTALGLFQTDNGIPDPDGQGTNFGPKTRAAMNNALQNNF